MENTNPETDGKTIPVRIESDEMNPRTLVVGYGSIGRRHVRLLGELGHLCAVVTAQRVEGVNAFTSIELSLKEFQPEYVVVASPTSRHLSDLQQIQVTGFDGPILIEKPAIDHVVGLPILNDSRVFVGYNLRFLAMISTLKQLIEGHRVLSVGFWNGQYLPEWRPNRRYQETSSAQQSLGGGVLRDLSHDLDLASFLFGQFISVIADISYSGSLQIDTEDTVHICAETEECKSVILHLSYLDRIPRHEIYVTTDRTSVVCDLLTGVITSPDYDKYCPTSRDETFKSMHQSVINRDHSVVCSLEEGLHIVAAINAVEESARAGCKVTL